jgi:RecJ-like exonuclease
MKCNKCNGMGYIVLDDKSNTICDFCWGKAELDWVENIIGCSIDLDVYNEICKLRKLFSKSKYKPYKGGIIDEVPKM